jgi:15-cis-phytoene synthase
MNADRPDRSAARSISAADQQADWTPREIMAYHARTFYWASRLMPQQIRRDIELLYSFCRYVDDVADETEDDAETFKLLQQIRTDLQAGSSELKPVAGFLELAERRGIELRCAEELVIGAGSDRGSVRIADRDELLRYCYRVASTVGLMMCAVLDVRDPQAHAYAIDLGLAMQLTNICRDVVEDFENDRIYLPASEADEPLVRAAVRDGDLDAQAAALGTVYDLLDLAYVYYRSADQGMCYLPWWARWAILMSSRAYEAIGKVVRVRGPKYWESRTFTRKRLKLWYTAKAGVLIALLPIMRDPQLSPRHRQRLHTALAGMPYADAAAPPLRRSPDEQAATPSLVSLESS